MDKMYYGYAAAEVMDGIIDPALMVKAMSLSQGDEKKGRAIYIELRAKELEAEGRKEKVTRIVQSTTSAATSAAETVKNHLTSDETINAAKSSFKVMLWVIFWIIFIFIAIYVFMEVADNANDSANCGSGRYFDILTWQCRMNHS